MKNNPFNKKSINQKNAISPLNNGEINTGLEGIVVKLIDYPDELRMKKTLSKMVKATIGSDPNEEIPDEVGEELFSGGLQTGLDSFMVIFEVYGVDRTITHQLVRTSKAKFHQQSSRFTYMGSEFNVRMPETFTGDSDVIEAYIDLVRASRNFYQLAVDKDIPYQDARYGCLEGTETYIICEYPLGVFLNTYSYRACPMFQWGINGVFKLMRIELLKKFPWIEPYIKISCEKIKKCTFQGWENTDGVCEFPWNKTRVFKSKTFSEETSDEKYNRLINQDILTDDEQDWLAQYAAVHNS